MDGLYEENPEVNPQAKLIGEISADELIEKDMEDLVLEPKTVEILRNAVNVREIRIVNGHKRGTIAQALRGEPIGTVIKA